MPQLHTQIYAGTRGTRDANTLRTLPAAGWRREVQNRPDTQNLHHGNVVGPDVLDSLTYANQEVRGVLPQRGLTGSTMQPYVLRPQPVPYQGGLYPKQGYAKHQRNGLAYLEEKPTHRVPMPKASFFDPGMSSLLGQPV